MFILNYCTDVTRSCYSRIERILSRYVFGVLAEFFATLKGAVSRDGGLIPRPDISKAYHRSMRFDLIDGLFKSFYEMYMTRKLLSNGKDEENSKLVFKLRSTIKKVFPDLAESLIKKPKNGGLPICSAKDKKGFPPGPM